MNKVYSVDDLLKLRASPLICRPSNLPPIEEWMGNQDVPTKRPVTNRKQDDGSLHSENFPKRTGFDSSQRKPATDPERIVLGPPRRSFASSNGRSHGKFAPSDSDDHRADKGPHHERHKTDEELDARLGDRRGFGGVNRHNNRHDQDTGHSEYSRRRHDDEEGEARSRREYDRPKWSTRETKDAKAGEEYGDESAGARVSQRRDQGRSRFEQPWFRGEKSGEEERRDNDRGWRRDRVKDGDWDTPGKPDIDPEWMDSIDNAEPAQAHTQEDFQRWKERMKAGASSSIDQKAEQSDLLPLSGSASEPETKPAPVAQFSSLISPDPTGNSMDKFFARFSEKQSLGDDKASAAKAAAKTRFASIFGPQVEVKPDTMPEKPVEAAAPSPAPMPPPAEALVDADQAGFQRILQMLGKKETTLPSNTDTPKPKTPFTSVPETGQRVTSPDLVALFKRDQPIRQATTAQAPVAPGYERLIESRSPVETHSRATSTPNKDELLLKLLRQAEISVKPQPQRQPPPPLQPHLQQKQYEHEPPALLALLGQAKSPRGGQRNVPDQERGGGPMMFDDPAISSITYPYQMISPDNAQRRGLNGATTAAFEDQFLDRLRSHSSQQKPTRSLPPGLQRPPGFESRMPPDWNQQQPLPSQNRPGPRSGLGSHGLPPPPPFGNGQQGIPPSMPQQMPTQSLPRQPVQRTYTGETPLPKFPPGMEPPGFMSHGPPPGFQHANAAQAAQGYGRFALGGNGQGFHQPGPPPSNMSRAFMDMYDNGDWGGMRGAGGASLPPGFH